ncbi:Mad3/BUB1 homology region 1-domain-containing protein [Dichomitus squalens]|uniref:Mad3/BUB1 homology region 1-domain-containing protein n=1 Tax=Dichomitus squalens TaxID=114155 RepID=A0A4Q9NQS9_9APHY|nr:Mad3/BUB1 homology region 1-domain-containing protein [Dichomitus squalens]TBU60436.1 Mad3/BUB1 homology region 1-domain-containing protein [Dichomitus squalens]
MADVFTPIVDCDVLEAAKENIQPLAAGRRVTALSAILSTPHAQREVRLADARKRHRTNVELALEDDSNDADPLEVYSRFVDWTVENYPQGHSAESGLLELLEEATRVLKDDRGGKWRGDLRYLKLWVRYASYVDKPTVIYKFLLVNEIGTNHALFYEEYAIALERANRRVEADETYLLGIARRAAPLERLEAKHREFQKRMMASPTLPQSSSSEMEPDAIPQSFAKRRVLGEPPARSRTTRSGATRAPSVSEDVFSAPAPPRPNARMPIFVDPSGDAENDPNQAMNPTPWPELGTRKSRVKENAVEVSKAAGTTMRAGRSSRAPSGSKITVFRDPGPEDASSSSSSMPPPPVPPAKKEKSRTASKSSLPIFRDDDEPAPEPTAKKSSGRAASKSSIAVFRDEDEAAPSELVDAAAKKGKGKTAGKSAIAVFKDEEEPSVPSTPKFMPFRDEEVPTPSAPSAAVPESVMKPKPAVKDVVMSAEAEALRKDPFKNYSAEERPIDD